MTATDTVLEVGPGRLVVRMPNWLGDAVLAVPALRALRRRSPQAHLELLARDGVAEVLAAVVGLADAVHRGGRPTPAGILADAQKLLGSAAAVTLPNSFPSALPAFLARVPVRVGTARNFRRCLLTHPLEPPPGRHQAATYLALVGEAPAVDPADAALTLAPGAVRAGREAAGGSSAYAVVVPGAAYGPAKRWGWERFAALGERLRAEGLEVLVLGSRAERELVGEVARACGARSLAGATSGAAFAGLLHGARVALVNDSGALHLAASLGVPAVALFGATDPRSTGPLSASARVLYHRVPCSPCGLRACNRPTHECMEAIGVEEAWAATIAQLEAAVGR